MTLAAFFDHNKIFDNIFRTHHSKESSEWTRIFTTRGQWETAKYGDVLAELQKLSLIQISVKRNNEFQFSIYPVVRDCIRLRKNHDKQQQFAEEAIIALMHNITEIDHFYSLDLEMRSEIYLLVDACICHEQALVKVSSGYIRNVTQTQNCAFLKFMRYKTGKIMPKN